MTNPPAADDEQPPPPPPQETNQTPPPLPFTSLALDLICHIISRVPKRHLQVLSCASKTLSHLVSSPDIRNLRSTLGRESLYISFQQESLSFSGPIKTEKWYSLKKNRFSNVNITFPFGETVSAIAIGPEIYFVCKPLGFRSYTWIFDSRSDRIRLVKEPGLNVSDVYPTIGLFRGKVYVIGRNYFRVQAKCLDIKAETWEEAPLAPVARVSSLWLRSASVTLDNKICAISMRVGTAACYDPRDGSCSTLPMFGGNTWRTGVCVMDYVLYAYYARTGLMWYDTVIRQWKSVIGVEHIDRCAGAVGLGEYNGKLAVLWDNVRGVVDVETKELWCKMIRLERREGEIHGIAGEPELLGTVPRHALMYRVLSVSD